MYKKNSYSSDTLGTLYYGASVIWLRSRDGWAEIQNSSGNIGYVPSDALTLAEFMDPDTGTDGDYFALYSELAPGSTGSDVKTLQARLKALGYFDGDIGGNYLTKTTAAVKAFQEEIGITQDGIATSALQDLIYASCAPKKGAYARHSSASYTDMYLGRQDEEVSALQLNLISLGYLSADNVSFGTYDEATMEAVLNVQISGGLACTDGIASAPLQALIATKILNK